MGQLSLYWTEEGPYAVERIRSKILGTAAAAGASAAAWTLAKERSMVRTALPLTTNAAVAAAMFSVCQEGVRAARQGEADGWNSFVAGGMTGAALTRLAYGKGFHLLGAVMWAPLCGGLHWLNAALQPVAGLKVFLASQGLLDLPAHEQQALAQWPWQQQQPQSQPQPQLQEEAGVAVQQGEQQQQQQQLMRFEDVSWRDKARGVDQIKRRELELLHKQLKGELPEQQAEQKPRKRRWRLFGA